MICVAGTNAQSVNLGNPPVLNFSKKNYKAGTQTWEIAQDNRGVVWFGNNDGLIEFDGTHWRLYPLDNGTIVRSVQASGDGKIYVGGQGDFGYFAPDAQGRMDFHSLKPLIPEGGQHFTDVWDVLVRDDGVFFRTDHQVFRYWDQRVTTLFPTGKSLLFMGEWKGKLLVQDGEFLLYVFENGSLRPLDNPRAFRNGRISSVLSLHPDTTLVTTIGDGIFFFSGNAFEPWQTQDDAFLRTNRIFCASLLNDGKIALGTSLNGVVTLDRQRRIFHHLNKKSGLQNNSVLSLLATPGGSLWLGLDNGIDFVDLSSPFSAFFPDGELQGTGYTARIFDGKIYFGTNSGLYATDWKNYYAPGEKYKFAPVRNSEGQVWSLNELGGALLMGHHEGAFDISGLDARKLTRLQGVWRFVPLAPGIAVAGHYNGLATFKKTPAGWVFDSTLTGLTESSRILAKDAQGDIWMAHPYRGIYRIRVHPDRHEAESTFFNARNGLPSDLSNHLFQLGDQVVFTGEHGIFRFDKAQERFLPDDNFNEIFGEKTRVRYLRQDNAGNIWYATDHETGVLRVETSTLEKKIRKIPIPELTDKLTGGFQFILPVDGHNVFIATGQGFIHFNPSAYMPKDSVIRLVLQEIRLKKESDSLLFGGHAAPGVPFPDITLPSDQNTLTFAFSATDYPGGEFVRYAHFLEGADRGWSEWHAEPDLTFSNLHPGKYTLHVKARNQHGVESRPLSVSFRIMPPWYASPVAYGFYTLALLALGAGVIYRQNKRFEQEKQDLQTQHQQREEQHQLQARRSEEAIIRLQNEKLEAEVNHKTQELASATMHLVQKNEILNSIKDTLEKLKRKVAAAPDLNAELGRIIKMLEHDLSMDADWEHFSHNFDQVHSDFLKRLGEQYPHLSPNDYKLCAYLRINLSSKEIASLMNISVRGVEASRYRLRKRLGLDTETNLTEFLMRF
ncbi:MAG: hypothetical protein EPGJADBJ_00864 [Saprospiraceae bacterium]|nr:hypothetical protein [Saprospiraceae bacterium]